jgi:peptide/nickel transport system substrate-binding protein
MSGRMSRRDFMKVSAAAAGALATGSAFMHPALASTANQQSLASHITIGNTSIQSNLNPFYFTYFQARQIYDTLIDVTADGELIPGIATEWNKVDPQTLEVTLRDDVFFSNGERCTANSVKFTMDFLLTEGVSNPGLFGIPLTDFVLFPPQFALFNNESIEVIDDTHLVIKSTRPDAILEKRFSRFWVFSEQYMTESDGNLVTDAIGTGYFKIVEFVPGELIELETWDGNWRGSRPVETATYVRVGDLRSALESGDIDVAQSLPPDVARTLIDSGNWNGSSKPALATEFVSMIPETHEALQDARVRRALNLAVDKDVYNQIVRAGFGQPTTGQLLLPGLPGYNEDLTGFEYNPEEAMRLLAEAGYSNLELTMLASNTVRTDAEVIAGYLESVGVRIELVTPDSGSVITEVRGGTQYNLVLWDAFYSTLADWTQAMVGLINPAPDSQRHFDNDEFYALNAQISVEGDEETRNDLIAQASALMYEEAAVLYISWIDFYYVHSPAIESIPFNLDNAPRIYDIEKRV